jgi:plastocyanin
VANGGTVRGVARLAQDVVVPPVRVTKDNERGCGPAEQPSERLVADPATKGVGNVVVTIPGLREGKDWPEGARDDARTVLVDQAGCRYVPHVAWARPGTQLVVANSDRADHNIHGYRGSMKDTAFNFSSEPGTRKDDIEQAFLDAPAVYILKCDIHPWMSGYVHVVGNPYVAVTHATTVDGRAPGEFVLTDVPPGEHTLVWWKEGSVETPSVADGKITAYTYSPDQTDVVKVTVKPGETVTVEIPIPVR